MEKIKCAFTNYIHQIIDQTNMSYEEGFNFSKLRNCLAKENILLRENIFDEKLYLVQAIVNKINLSEAKKIVNFSEQTGIKIIFMKGIFFSSEIYNDINLRVSMDIDLYVKECDLYKICEFLTANGYNDAGENDFLEDGRMEHLQFVKAGKNMYNLTIEVHTCASYPYDLFKRFSESAYKNTISVNSFGVNATVLSYVDQVILLLIHFSRHTVSELDELKDFNYVASSIPLKDLYDICLLIRTKDISFEELDARIEETETQIAAYYALKCLNEIAPDFLPVWLVDKIKLRINELKNCSNKIDDKYSKHLCSNTLLEDLLKVVIKEPHFINLDFSNVVKLGRKKERLFDFKKNGCEGYLDGILKDESVQFEFVFSNHVGNIENQIIFVHYRIASKSGKELFNKLQINITKEDSSWKIIFLKPWQGVTLYDLSGLVKESESHFLLQVNIPARYFAENTVASYSVDFASGETYCITGDMWDNLMQMKHFELINE